MLNRVSVEWGVAEKTLSLQSSYNPSFCTTDINLAQHKMVKVKLKLDGGKGGVGVTGAVKILALPKRGGGLTHAKIFWWICRCILKTLLRHHSTQIMKIYPPKSEHFSPKIDHHQHLLNIYPKSNRSLPKMVIYALFTSKCRESHLHAFVVKSTRVPGSG